MAEKKSTTQRKPAAKKGISHEISTHRFSPGTEVGLYPDADVGPERNTRREPIPEPLAEAKVADDGALKIQAPAAGTYAVAGKDGDEWKYVTVTVKKD